MNRRELIRFGGGLSLALAGTAYAPSTLSRARDPRFVLVILRGGMDGLAAVPAYGDPAYRKSRGELALGDPGSADGVRDLDGYFGLHPAFEHLHALFEEGAMSVVHAVAPPYRERSHFDGQDVLEAGVPDPSGTATGWLYRALDVCPHARDGQYAYALGSGVPLVLRGPNPVGTWAPDRLPQPDQSTMARVMALYEADEALGPKLMASLQSDAIAGQSGRVARSEQLALVAETAARFLGRADGPRIAVIDSGGWDTHARQGRIEGQLGARFAALDRALGEFRVTLGDAWADTVVAVVTEFGRTVAMNGTRGSDHGYGSAAFLLGGALRGGRVIGDWPGLKPGQLYEGRDLMATTDMRSLFAGVLVDHLGAAPGAVADRVFPGHHGRLSNLV